MNPKGERSVTNLVTHVYKTYQCVDVYDDALIIPRESVGRRVWKRQRPRTDAPHTLEVVCFGFFCRHTWSTLRVKRKSPLPLGVRDVFIVDVANTSRV